MIRSLFLGLALAMSMTLTGCLQTTGSVDGGGAYMWYDVYGNGCLYLTEGCTYLDPNGFYKTTWIMDPYYNPWQTPTYAFVYDTQLHYYTYAYGYWGINNIFYDYYTERAINEGAAVQSYDILTIMGQREEDVIRIQGQQWAAKYQLDESTGIRVARAANDWNKIAKNRARTEADLADFTKRVYGVQLDDVTKALNSNDKEQMQNLLESAASTWGTSPEHMRSIVNSIYHTSL